MKNFRTILILLLFCALNGYSQTHALADEYWSKAKKAEVLEDWENTAILFEKSAEAEKKSPNPRLEDLVFALQNAAFYYNKNKNYDKALKVLRSRIYEIELQKKLEEDAKHRKTMVSSGDRSAKIRTYNYPQGRVTEHRIGLTKYNLQNVIGGDIQEFIDELQLAENAEKLKVGTTSSDE